MRAGLTLVLALLPVLAAAQLPRDLSGIVRTMPSLDGFIKSRPLETTFDDTLGQLRLLDRVEMKRAPGDMKRLARTGPRSRGVGDHDRRRLGHRRGGSDVDTYDPGGGVAVPSGGGQTRGASGR